MTKVGSLNIPVRYMILRYAIHRYTLHCHTAYILHLTSWGFTLKVLTGRLHAAQEVDLGGIEWGRAL